MTYVRLLSGQFLTFFSPISEVGFIQAKVVRLFPPAKELVGSLFADMIFEFVFLFVFLLGFAFCKPFFSFAANHSFSVGFCRSLEDLYVLFLGLSEIRQILPVKGRMRV